MKEKILCIFLSIGMVILGFTVSGFFYKSGSQIKYDSNTKTIAKSIDSEEKTLDTEDRLQEDVDDKSAEEETIVLEDEDNKELEQITPQEENIPAEPVTTPVVVEKPVLTTTTKPVVITTLKPTQTTTTIKVKQVISNEKEEVTEVLEEKYGTKKIKAITYNVIKYDDGSIEKNYSYDKTYYDKSGYNASTNDLLSEAKTVASQNRSIYQEVVGYVNGYRSAAGVEQITLDDELSVAATVRALEMAYSSGGMSHTRPNGSDCFTIFDELNINYMFGLGENVAAGQTTASMVAQSWYNSPGHRANMEYSVFTKIGIGMYELGGTKYWVQLFVG